MSPTLSRRRAAGRAAFDAADLQFFGDLAPLAEPTAFAAYLAAQRRVKWVVYAKRPFGGPRLVLDYLGRYTHRVAIANGRLLDCVHGRVRFRWKDYRVRGKSKAMSLDADEFIRRFLMHVLPNGFRRIRHLGFLANPVRAGKLAQISAALDAPEPPPKIDAGDYRERAARLTGRRLDVCPCCGGRMVDIALWSELREPALGCQGRSTSGAGGRTAREREQAERADRCRPQTMGATACVRLPPPIRRSPPARSSGGDDRTFMPHQDRQQRSARNQKARPKWADQRLPSPKGF